MKRCTKCRCELPDRDFHRDPRTSDGLQPWCKSCKRISARDYQRRVRSGQQEIRARVRRARPMGTNVELPLPPELDGPDPDTIFCLICGEKRTFDMELITSRTIETCRCGTRYVSINRPATFRRYESTGCRDEDPTYLDEAPRTPPQWRSVKNKRSARP